MKCSFCGEEIKKGTGILYVRKTGTMLGFCSQKCKRNLLKLGRKPRKMKWTAVYQK